MLTPITLPVTQDPPPSPASHRNQKASLLTQTVSDYPLVEAIHQNVVKHPVLPDAASRAKLYEHKSAIFTERYDDYLKLGIEE